MHPSIELLSQLLSGTMLSTLLRSALHTKPFSTNSKWETFPKIPSQAWACSPEFLGSQTQPLLPILSSSLINCCIPGRQLEEYVTQSSSNEENNCCSSDCDNNKHLHSWKCSSALPPGTTQTFLWCQSVEDKVRNSWGDRGIQLRNKAKQKKGKGQLLDQLICSATLSGDMSMKFIEDGKVHLWVIKDTRKTLSNKNSLLFQAREAAEKWRWYFQQQNISYVLLGPAQETPKLQGTIPEAKYFKLSESITRQLGCPTVKFLTNNTVTLQLN